MRWILLHVCIAPCLVLTTEGAAHVIDREHSVRENQSPMELFGDPEREATFIKEVVSGHFPYNVLDLV